MLQNINQTPTIAVRLIDLRSLNRIHGMFGLITRIRQAQAERLRREKFIEEQNERIARGFRELHTAVELVGQVAGGRGPRGNVVLIGDGFFVERTEDGKERTVFLERNPADEPYKAKVENFKAGA